VNHHEPSGTISFYWEFGGGDAIAMIPIADLGLEQSISVGR
jgi:hypothetical protein